MASLIPGYEYDIFISYRQKDNKYDGWVTEFVGNLKKELESMFKYEVSVYFDINPSDYLLESYDVDASLKDKLKCLVFIPIISRTYCDSKSFAWEHEFKAFVEQASHDQFGLKIKLPNGNVASRVLPIRIHDLDSDDFKLCESVLGGVLRGVEFIYKEPGVNRSLSPKDHEEKNLNNTNYRNQINKVALAIKEIISGLKAEPIDLTKEKIQQREPLEEVFAEEKQTKNGKSTIKNSRRLLSGIAILTTLIIVIVLAYPKIFRTKDNLQEMTMTISVMNENGEKEIRKVFKDEYIAKLSLFPFTNETNDSSENWFQYGIYDAIMEDLNQFNYVKLGSSSIANRLQEQIKYAQDNSFPYFLTGAFRIADGKYEITSRLYKASNGTIEKERIFKGNDFFNLIDSVSLQTRIDLGISEKVLNSSPDLPFKEHSTDNFNAFQYYIKGLYIDSLYTNLQRSIKLDSTFALASYRHASQNYNYQSTNESAHLDISRAMRHRNRLTEYNDISTLILYYLILGENDKAIALSEMQYELQPHNTLLLGRLLDTYHRNFMIYKYEKAAQQMAKLIPNIPEYRINLARGHLFTWELNKGLEILEKLLKDNPENVNALLQMGEIYLHNNDLEAAEKTYQKAILIQPEDEKYWSRIFDYITYSRNNPIKREFLEPFTGNYRFEDSEMNVSIFMHNNYLVVKAKNQSSHFNYPVSDTQFISLNGTAAFTFAKNNLDEVIKTTLDQNNRSRITWKEDSLILKAINLLNAEIKTEALNAFRKAYTHNPDHYYLANFIQHLEFIQSQEYERIKPVFETYVGKYGKMMIFKKNDNLYYETISGLMYKLLPLSEGQFMIPSFYNSCIQIIKKNNSVAGLKFVYRDGKEEFFSRDD